MWSVLYAIFGLFWFLLIRAEYGDEMGTGGVTGPGSTASGCMITRRKKGTILALKKGNGKISYTTKTTH